MPELSWHLPFRQQLQNSSARPVYVRKRHAHPVADPQTHEIRSLRTGRMGNDLVLTLQPDANKRSGKKLHYDAFSSPFSMSCCFFHVSVSRAATSSLLQKLFTAWKEPRDRYR